MSLIAAASRCPVRAYFIQSSDGKNHQVIPYANRSPTISGGRSVSIRYGTKSSQISPAIGDHYADVLDSYIKQCSEKEWRTASDHDVRVRSEKYGISGVIDRIFEEPPYFSIVRPVTPPAAGIYSQDRIRVTAYALCLSEMFAKEIRGGNSRVYSRRRVEVLRHTTRGYEKILFRAEHWSRNIEAGQHPQKTGTCTVCLMSLSAPVRYRAETTFRTTGWG